MNDEQLRDQINQLIRDEIQEDINDYVDAKEQSEKAGLGFVEKDEMDCNDILPKPATTKEKGSQKKCQTQLSPTLANLGMAMLLRKHGQVGVPRLRR